MSDKKMIYYTVRDAQAKVRALVHTVDQHLQQKERLQIVASDVKAMHFISDMLWSFPKESMRPHSIGAPLRFQDLILLSLPSSFHENFPTVFNLSQEALDQSSFKLVYELEDLSAPLKGALFQKKFQLYQKAGISISTGVFA